MAPAIHPSAKFLYLPEAEVNSAKQTFLKAVS
jgi:hypothetical protein